MKKNRSIICIGITLIFLSCSKVSDTIQVSDNFLLFKDYVGYFGALNVGELQKYTYKGDNSFAFSFNSNKTKTISFSIYRCAFCANYRLEMNKNDTGIILNKIYTNNNISEFIRFSALDVSGNYKVATKTELKFTKYQDPGLIVGSFKTYMNSTLWCEANFSFIKKLN